MAKFNGTNGKITQSNALVVAQFPYTVGFWFRLATGIPASIFALTATGAVQHYAVWCNNGNQFNFEYWNGASNGGFNITIAQNEWTYGVFRSISATNRRICALRPSGAITHGNSTASVTMAAANKLCIGLSSSSAENDPFSGDIAELFYANADIQPDGLQLSDSLVQQLAYYGPWSVPSVAGNVVEYRSLRYASFGSTDDIPGGDVYQRNRGLPWVAANITAGDRPPLAGNYRRPGDTPGSLIV